MLKMIKDRTYLPLAPLSLALALVACAAPSTRHIDIHESSNQAEQEIQNEIALEGLVNDDLRLQAVAYDLESKNTALCGDFVKYDMGMYFLGQGMIPAQFGNAAQKLYKIGQHPKVLLVYPASAAQDAGIKVGDEIISMNDWVIPVGTNSGKIINEKLEQLLKDGAPVALKINRGSEEMTLSVQPRKQCAFPVILNGSDALNAYADGDHVFITRGMMRFTQNDTELALVVSHEMSHNTMRHMKAQNTNYVLGSILDILIAATTGVNTQGGFGNMAAMRYSKEFEAEADYVGLYMMAVAGKDIDSAPKFWRRMAAAHPAGIEADNSSTHPSTAYRFLALEETVKEIHGKQETGAPLVPEMKQAAASHATTPPTPSSSTVATSSMQAPSAAESIDGSFSGKSMKSGGLSGLLKGIDIKITLTNKTGKAISNVRGEARLSDAIGHEIGSFSFQSEHGIPANGTEQVTHTFYPVMFPGYGTLKELSEDQIRIDFTYQTIEFADGSSATK
jgi:hypothetical protein